MVLDKVFGQFDSNSFKKLIFAVNFSRILNDGNFLAPLIVIGKVDMLISNCVPVEQSLSSISVVSFSYAFVDKMATNNKIDNHTETISR